MSKVLVLYYSTYGHIETLAQAMAEGARSTGAQVDLKRVPETVPPEVAKTAHFKLEQAAPVATVAELEHYDAIIVGVPTRFGRMPAQMAAFLDQAGGLWARGALHGKVGGAFTSSATQHGGQEVTLFSVITNLLHFGLIIVGLPYSFQGQTTIDEIVGGIMGGFNKAAMAVGKPVFHALDWLGSQPAHIYRTIRTMDERNQWQAAVGATVGVVGALATRNPNAGTLAQLNRIGLYGLAGGAFGAAATNPIDFAQAFQASANGERTFKRSAIQRADELLGDPRIITLAREVADAGEFHIVVKDTIDRVAVEIDPCHVVAHAMVRQRHAEAQAAVAAIVAELGHVAEGVRSAHAALARAVAAGVAEEARDQVALPVPELAEVVRVEGVPVAHRSGGHRQGERAGVEGAEHVGGHRGQKRDDQIGGHRRARLLVQRLGPERRPGLRAAQALGRAR